MISKVLFTIFSYLCLHSFFVQSAYASQLERKMEKLAAKLDGKVGICILNLNSNVPICVNGTMRFPLQSVMKMIVGATVLDAVDSKKMSLSDSLSLLPSDASPGPQDFANLIRTKGILKVSLEELLRRSISESDSTAVDKLLEHLGGVLAVKEFLKKNKIDGISIDRNERWVQADSLGLEWDSKYADNQKFETAIKELPFSVRNKAASRFLTDSRDTSTPMGMVSFLRALGTDKLLSKKSTQKILDIMTSTVTGPNRLLAGTPTGWKLAHKTGTGRSWQGMNSATNDVGILSSPNGEKIAVAAFVSGSSAPADKRESLIAEAARLAVSTLELSKLDKEQSL